MEFLFKVYKTNPVTEVAMSAAFFFTAKEYCYSYSKLYKNMDSYSSPRTRPLYRGTQIVWYILGLIEALLAFRFVLKLLGANPAVGFSNFIYSVTYPLAAPFLNVFRMTRVAGSIFEWTTLLAMLMYWLLALGILKLFIMSKSVSTPEAAAKLDSQEK